MAGYRGISRGRFDDNCNGKTVRNSDKKYATKFVRCAGLSGLTCPRCMTLLRAQASPLICAYDLTACGGLKRLVQRRVYGLAARVASR